MTDRSAGSKWFDALGKKAGRMRAAHEKGYAEAADEGVILPTEKEMSRVMSMLGRLGGKIGGHARAAALSKEQRRKIASDAAKKRWRKA